MKTSTNVDDMRVGTLLHRKDGRSFYIFAENKTHFAYYSRCSAGNRLYVSVMKRQYSFNDEKFEYAIDGIYNNVDIETIANALSIRKQPVEDFEKLLEQEKEVPYTDYAKNENSGPKSALQPGSVFLDRHRRLHHVCYVDGDKLHTIILNEGNWREDRLGHMIVDLSEYRDNLKHKSTRRGIQIVIGSEESSKQVAGIENLMSDLKYGNIKNDDINAAKNSIIVDLRTNKDLGDRKIPKYKHDVWQKDLIKDEVILGVLSKEAYSKQYKQPTIADKKQFQALARKHLEFARTILTDLELKVFAYAKERRKTSAGNIREDLDINMVKAARTLRALCGKGLLMKGNQGKSKENFICYRIY